MHAYAWLVSMRLFLLCVALIQLLSVLLGDFMSLELHGLSQHARLRRPWLRNQMHARHTLPLLQLELVRCLVQLTTPYIHDNTMYEEVLQSYC